jgi:hypothetical protein
LSRRDRRTAPAGRSCRTFTNRDPTEAGHRVPNRTFLPRCCPHSAHPQQARSRQTLRSVSSDAERAPVTSELSAAGRTNGGSKGTISLNVRLDDLDLEGQPFEQIVQELDGGLLVAPWIGAEYPDPGAVVDGGELVVLLASRAANGLDELHVDLDPLAGELLLVALEAILVTFVALGGGEPGHPELVKYPPDPRRADPDVVIALEVHRDLVRAEVVVARQVDDPRDHLGLGRVRAVQRDRGPVPEPGLAELLVATCRSTAG